MNGVKISIVSPEYKGATLVGELVLRIKAALTPITEDFEIILVNDASPDDTWEQIKLQCAQEKRVKGVNLSRNFGENYAITAGLRYARGEWIVVMDCDLQNRPEDIPALLAKAQEGYDIVYARRTQKTFGFFKRLSSKLYHSTLQWLSGVKHDSAVAEFGIYSSQVIAEYNKLPEAARSFANLITSLGFRSAFIDVKHAERGDNAGSSYTFSKLLKVAADVIISNSNKPLKIVVGIGSLIVALSIVMIIYTLIAYAVTDQPAGFSSTFISIWFLGGLNIFILGIVGLYIDRIFNQVKGRPLFIVKETINE